MSEVSLGDLRVLFLASVLDEDGRESFFPHHRPLTPAERDSLGRAWLRDKIGDVEVGRWLEYVDARGDLPAGIGGVLSTLLDALDGGQE